MDKVTGAEVVDEAIEDALDIACIEERQDEECIPWEKVVHDLGYKRAYGHYPESCPHCLRDTLEANIS